MDLADLATKSNQAAFDPEGSGYDHKTANELKKLYPLTLPRPQEFRGEVVADTNSFEAWIWHPERGNYLKHSSSRDPRTGMMLKGRKHDTFEKAVESDLKLGYELQKGKDGRYYSFKGNQ